MPTAEQNNPPYQLITADGTPITATLETIPGEAIIDDEITIHEGEPTFHYFGETNLFWNDQRTTTRYGETLFVCENDKEHLAGDLLLRHSDGSTTPYAGSIDSPYAAEEILAMTQNRRLTRATELLSWIMDAIGRYEAHLITKTTFERATARAKTYAVAEGLHQIVADLHATLQTKHGLTPLEDAKPL